MKKIMLVAIFLIALGSCKKEGISPIQDEAPSSVNDSLVNTGRSKGSSSSILAATSASQIPSQVFDSYLEYKAWYQHQKQPNSTSCSWTSYVNCVGTIVRGASANTTQYTTPISTIQYRCANYYPQANTYGSNSIMALNWHAGAYDGNKINYQLQSTGNRFTATKYMLAHLNTHHTPFVAISKIGNTSHFRVVFSINWKKLETTSTVYYTDCVYANQGNYFANQRSMTLQEFLDLMLNPPVVKYYNMLFMWNK